MRKQSITSIIVLVCLGVVAATTINAQSPRRFVIDIPFQFAVAGRMLPAGKYAVERIDPTKPNVVMVKNTDNGIVRLLITQRVESHDTSTTSSLLFTRHGDEFCLFEVWMMGENHGHRMQSGDECSRPDRRGPSMFIRLRITRKRPKSLRSSGSVLRPGQLPIGQMAQ